MDDTDIEGLIADGVLFSTADAGAEGSPMTTGAAFSSTVGCGGDRAEPVPEAATGEPLGDGAPAPPQPRSTRSRSHAPRWRSGRRPADHRARCWAVAAALKRRARTDQLW